MKLRTLPISSIALAGLALAITACGGVTVTAKPDADAAALKLVTLRVGPSVTQAALQAVSPEAQVLLFDGATGRAVVAVPDTAGTLQASGLGGLKLGQLDAGVLAIEADSELKVQSDPETMGLTSWAGGLTSWAGGALSWAGGQTFLQSGDLNAAYAYWDKIGLSRARTLMPELGSGVKVAVIDTGVDLNHPLLVGRFDTVADWDFVDNDDSPAEGASTGAKYGHGTGVAGVILQIAPNAKLLAYRTLGPDGTGDMSNVVAAMNKAVHSGAKIINISLGSTANSQALNTAIAAALASGVLVVNSSGNAGTEGMLYPARNLGSSQFLASSGLIGVGSVNLGLVKSAFSTYASNMTMTAPGETVLTTFPDGRLVRASGTSFAAPAVTGALALAMSAGVTSPSTLVSGLKSSATKNLDSTFGSKLGAGTLNVGSFADLYR